MLNFYSLEFHGYSVALLIAIFILSLLISFLISGLYYKGKIDDLKIKLHSSKYQKSKFDKEIKALTDRLQEREQEFNILRGELHNKEVTISHLKEKIANLNRVINNKTQEIERIKQQQKPVLLNNNADIEDSFFDKSHYGDLDYWTGERLYTIMHTSKKKRSLREMEELTGIKYTTIRYRVKQYIDLHTTI